MSKILKLTKGQGVVEIIVSVALFAIVFTGGWQFLNIANQRINQNIVELKADYLVIEGLETIRAMRNEDWNALVVADEQQAHHFELVDNLISIVPGTETVTPENIYTRSVFIETARRDSNFVISDDPLDDLDPNTKLIRIRVEWTVKNEVRYTETSIYFTNWNQF